MEFSSMKALESKAIGFKPFKGSEANGIMAARVWIRIIPFKSNSVMLPTNFPLSAMAL